MRRHRLITFLALTFIFFCGRTRASYAAWQVDGAEVCIADSSQGHPTIVSDGAGGAIIAWVDKRSSTQVLYAQHSLVSGAMDPAWTANGVALCTANNDQIEPQIVSDGAGGAIVAWGENDNGLGRVGIHAQRVDADGALRWASNGVQLSQWVWEGAPRMVSDGVGGAIITWSDARGIDLDAGWDIYAQRVNASGVPQWTTGGVPVCTATDRQDFPRIVSDGAEGAIITWADSRDGPATPTFDIYAQHVSAIGELGPSDGVALCTEQHSQNFPTIASDGAGGAIVTWEDGRGGTNSGTDIYAQRFLASGAVDSNWPSDGVALCTAFDGQGAPQIVPDGAGGAIVTWQDGRNAALSGTDIFAQHVLATGAVDSNWPPNGRALCTAPRDQQSPTIVEDGSGGAIISWQDSRKVAIPGGTGVDIYAQRVTGTGTALWTSFYDGNGANNGVALCEAAGDQLANPSYPTISCDGAGGGIVTWQDRRASVAGDIYARRAQPPGSPTIDVVWGSTFIQVVWTGGGDVADTGTPLRWVVYVDGDSVGGLAQASGVQQVVEVDGPPSNPSATFTPCSYHDVYVNIIGQHGFLAGTSNTVSGQTCCGTMCDQVRPRARAQGLGLNYPLALGSPHPNPARDDTKIRWSIPRELTGERFQLALFDVGGRKVTTVAEGNAEAGLFARQLQSQGEASLTSGVYFLRLQIGGKQLTRSLIVAR